jgi:heme/copper-type cytochrome/quinol oxidase subunit 2
MFAFMGVGPVEAVMVLFMLLGTLIVPVSLVLIVYFLWAKHRRDTQHPDQQRGNLPEDSRG